MLTASYNLQAPINHYGLSQQGITLVKNRSHSDCKLVSTGVDNCKVPSIFFFQRHAKEMIVFPLMEYFKYLLTHYGLHSEVLQ